MIQLEKKPVTLKRKVTIKKKQTPSERLHEIIQFGAFYYECTENKLDIWNDDGEGYTIDLNKLTPAMIEEIIVK